MQWTDEGIVLGVKRHGEANAILELMTREHGRHLGLVRGGFGSRLKPVLQPGNSCQRAHGGRGSTSISATTRSKASHCARRVSFRRLHAIYGVTHLAALMRLLPERDPHAAPLRGTRRNPRRTSMTPSLARRVVVRFELQILSELGFGLDLARCAATGAPPISIYVSPKSGRAVSRSAGEPWADKMLRAAGIPARTRWPCPPADDLADGFALTGFFLTRHVLEPRGLALGDERAHFIAALNRALPSVA